LKAAVQETETIARSGGDEFVVLLPRISGQKDAIQTAVNIGNALKAAFDLGQSKLDIQASIGIALFPEHGASADDLLQRAEVAMYSAKQEKSGYTVYEDKQEQNSPRRVTLVGELRQALERDELLLQYQPKIDVKNNQVTEVEVLSRWRHPRHGVIPPEEFVPLAERTGLIKIVTAWVLKNALHQLGEWSRAGIELGLAVNISTQDLHDQELYDRVTGLLAANRLDASQLVLEITETSIMIDTERATSMLERLAGSGIRIAIDDFGTGYSSLAHLSVLPVKEIKIDKSFVIDMKDNPKHANIVRAIIDLGHNLDMKVVGEGVESEYAYRQLQKLRCDSIQGDYLSKPIDADDLAAWLLDTSRMRNVQNL
jgi:predicted signal transduction protein with EAL and GGDEF domain